MGKLADANLSFVFRTKYIYPVYLITIIIV